MKKVSILIPCYNSEKWVGETLDCCLRQTYPNIEVVLVDDGSTDNSLAIAREYEKKDKRIRVFSQPNSGGCRARNLAFEKSTGDYIKYLDADDLISDDMIEKQVELLLSANFDLNNVVYTDCNEENIKNETMNLILYAEGLNDIVFDEENTLKTLKRKYLFEYLVNNLDYEDFLEIKDYLYSLKKCNFIIFEFKKVINERGISYGR